MSVCLILVFVVFLNAKLQNWGHETSFSLPCFIEVLVQCQESQRPCIICVLRGIDFSSFCDFSILFLEMSLLCGIFCFSFYYICF